MQYSAGINLKVSQQQRSKAEIALPIESHRRPFERQWATPFSTDYQDGGQEPEVVINLASFIDNNIIQNLKIGWISRQHLILCDNGQYILYR